MAAVVNGPTATNSTSNLSTYTSNSFTPVVGDLLVAFAMVTDSETDPGALTASANGITFTKVGEAVKVSSTDTLYCFVANQLVPSSPSSMTVTMDVTGDAGSGCIIAVARVSGVTRVGLDAIRQFDADDNVASGTAPSNVFAAACLTDNPTLQAVFTNVSTGSTPPTNWTERVDVTYATPTTGGGYSSRDSGFTGTTITLGSTSNGQCCSFAVEVDASTATVDKNSSDTATGTDAATLAAAVSTSDTAAGSEAATLTVEVSSADAATGSEGQSVEEGATPVSDSDSATGSDDQTLVVQISSSDTATGSDDAAPAADLTSADAATGTDSGILAAALTSTDESSGSDDQTPPVVALTSEDGATGSDAVDARTLGATDAGAGADAESVAAAITSTDEAAAAEATGPRDLTSADAATGTDELLLLDTGATPISGSDSATGTETESVEVTLTSSDAATGSEGVLDRTLGASDTATGSDDEALSVAVSATDAAVGVDTQGLAAELADADLAAGVDTDSPPGVELGSSDAATAVEIAALDALLAAFDDASGDDAHTDRELTSADAAAGVDDGTVRVPRDVTAQPGPHVTGDQTAITGPPAPSGSNAGSSVVGQTEPGPHVT